MQGYQGILCGRCVSGFGREGNICRKCASSALRSTLLAALILWSFIFLSYIIRSMLQLSTRIEFNKKFNLAMDRRRRGPVVETLPAQASESVPEIGPNGASGVHIEMVDLSLNPITEVSPSLDIDSQKSAESEVQEQPDRITSVTANASKKSAKRLSKRQVWKSTGVTCEGNMRKRGRLVTIFKAMLDPNTTEEVEPLILSNPVSECLKVCQFAIPPHLQFAVAP